MGNYNYGTSCTAEFYKKYAYEQYDLVNIGWYFGFYNVF